MMKSFKITIIAFLVINFSTLNAQNNLKTWTETTVNDFIDNQLNNLIVNDESGGEVQLQYPLVNTIQDYNDNKYLRGISKNSNGDIVRTWFDNGNIFVKKYAPNRSEITKTIKVNDGSKSISYAICYTAILDNGTYIVTWSYDNKDNRKDMYGQIYYNDSIRVGNNFKIAGSEDNAFHYAYPIANNKDNSFSIFYSRRVNYVDKAYVEKRDYYGNKIGDTQRLNQNEITTTEYTPMAVADEDGYWAAWFGINGLYPEHPVENLFIRHYKYDGTPLGEAIRPIDSLLLGTNSNLDLCIDNDSHLFITWYEPDNNGYNKIIGQLFDSSGNSIGTAVKLNSIITSGNNQAPEVEYENNEFHISWWCDNKIYVTGWKLNPKLLGEMISSIYDSSPEGSIYDEISWDYKAYPASNVRFQLRSGNTINEVKSSTWYGPINSSDYYTDNTRENINNIHNGNRYIQYKTNFSSDYGNSSILKSISISYTTNDSIPPKPPLNLTVVIDHEKVVLNWQSNNDTDIWKYKIYRSREAKNYSSGWYKIIPQNTTSFVDSSAEAGKIYYYVVSAIDSSRNESVLSNEARINFYGKNIYVSSSGSSSGDGSINNPVNTIKQGMNLASPGDTLRIMPGTYTEDFSIKSRVSLIGAGADKCIINSQIKVPDDCIVSGLKLTNYVVCLKGSPIITKNIIRGGDYGIALSDSSSPIITKNFISECNIGIDTETNYGGYLSNPIIKNNIIIAKQTGVDIYYTSTAIIINNIINATSAPGNGIRLTTEETCKIENNILLGEIPVNVRTTHYPDINYNAFYKPKYPITQLPITNITVDPQFVNEYVQDYHLQLNSPCINTGNPDPSFNDIDGTRNDIGAYGGPNPFDLNLVTQLTKSVYVSSVSGYPGDTISVFVSLDNSAGLAEADFTFEFNNTLLKFIDAELTESTHNFSLTHLNLSSNEIKFSISSNTGTTINSKDILKINFLVNSNSRTDDASSLILKDAKFFDASSTEIYIRSLTNGAFVVNSTNTSENYIYVDDKNSVGGNGNRNNPYNTITAAINSASEGDTILVAGGNYRETLIMKEGVYLIGSGSLVTNIICTQNTGGVKFINITKGEISRFAFRSENFNPDLSAIILCWESSPVIKKNLFETELPSNFGVGCYSNSNPVIENNNFNHMDISIDESSPIIKDNFISANPHGIFCLRNSNPVITGNIITAIDGGGVMSFSKSGATIKNNIIYCNSGLGIEIFEGNDTKVFNNIIKDRGPNGTGLKIINSSNIEIINNTISTRGIGIDLSNSTSNIQNNIIVNNLNLGVSFSTVPVMDYNAFWNNSVNYNEGVSGIHNINSNIMFTDTSKMNYRLLPGSPCINAGNPDLKYNDVDNSRNDIGAYGGPFADSSWIAYDGSILAVNQINENDTVEVKINGERVKGIAGMSLELSYDPLILTLLDANSSDLTRSFSVEKTNQKPGVTKLFLKSNRGISGDKGGLVEIKFVSHSPKAATTTLHFNSASVWDETSCSKNVVDLKDGQINVISGIENGPKLLPQVYSLSQNYPNPFNPVTVINYQLPVNSNVTLKVYDILGREIITLVDQQKKPGIYQERFNGTNLASGVYIYRLTASSIQTSDKFVKSVKMMLIK